MSGTQVTLQGTLFGNNEPGFTFEPWDITTLYQDRAGTTPVTAAGQSVGYRRDKSGRGNHQVAVSDAKRGVYGWMPKTGKRNLLTYTSFEGAVSGTPGTAPTGFSFNASGGSITSVSGGVIAFSATAARQIVGSAVSVAANETHTWRIQLVNNSNGLVFNQLFAAINTAGVVSLAYKANGATIDQTSYVPVSGDVLSATMVNGASPITPVFRFGVGATAIATGSASFKEPQAEVGASATAYQRVVSQYDITEAGVPTCYYVQADGVDDAYVTPTITPGTDKVQVFAGMRKLSDAATSIFMESSGSSVSNTGAFGIFTPDGANKYIFLSRGTTSAFALTTSTSFAAPVTNVFTGIGDISADTSILRIDGSQIASSVTDQGTGNFLAYPIYIYARSGGAIPFNGLDFGHAVRFGPSLSAATIAQVERLIARNTPEVTL